MSRDRALQRVVQHRLRVVERRIGEDLARLRSDAAASKADVEAAAGIDRTFIGRVESGDAHASLQTMIAIATSLGGDLSVRVYAGSGPGLTDRHQARMIEAMLQRLAPVWRPHLEVQVFRPARGFIDVVFEHRIERRLVVSEAYSSLPRLEQQIRWTAEKAGSIGSSDLVRDGLVPAISKLLILRSTESTRAIARMFASTLGAAYPAGTRDAVAALTDGSPWPGDAIVWVRIEGDQVELMDGPPRGVSVGR